MVVALFFAAISYICHNVHKNKIAKTEIMKVVLDIPDNKAASLMDVLRSISYVKVKPFTDEKNVLVDEIKEAVEEMKLIRAGKKKARNAEAFLNEL
jgi:hypothetical protein